MPTKPLSTRAKQRRQFSRSISSPLCGKSIVLVRCLAAKGRHSLNRVGLRDKKDAERVETGSDAPSDVLSMIEFGGLSSAT